MLFPKKPLYCNTSSFQLSNSCANETVGCLKSLKMNTKQTRVDVSDLFNEHSGETVEERLLREKSEMVKVLQTQWKEIIKMREREEEREKTEQKLKKTLHELGLKLEKLEKQIQETKFVSELLAQARQDIVEKDMTIEVLQSTLDNIDYANANFCEYENEHVHMEYV